MTSRMSDSRFPGSMTTHDQARPALASFFSFIVMLGAILQASCADSLIRTSPPPSGMGVLDTTPEASRRARINDMRIVAVNSQPATGDEAELSAGKNRVRVGFSCDGGHPTVFPGHRVQPEGVSEWQDREALRSAWSGLMRGPREMNARDSSPL